MSQQGLGRICQNITSFYVVLTDSSNHHAVVSIIEEADGLEKYKICVY